MFSMISGIMFKSNDYLISELYKLQIENCCTDLVITGKDSSISIHKPMLQTNLWLLDCPDGDALIFPDLSDADLKSLVQKLYCHDNRADYRTDIRASELKTCTTQVPATGGNEDPPTPFFSVPSTPDQFYTAPETPTHPSAPVEELNRSKQLDNQMVEVSINLLKSQLKDALSKKDFVTFRRLEDEITILQNNIDRVVDNDDNIVRSPFINNDDVEIKGEVSDNDDTCDTIEIQIKQSPVLCSECGKEFPTSVAASHHKYNVHGKSIYSCDVCGKVCEGRRSLTNHKRQHSKKYCDICHEDISSANFQRHRSKCLPQHESPQIHECAICDFKTNIKSKLLKHIQSHVEPPKKHNCPSCDYASYSKCLVRNHIKEVHESIKYHCDKCTRKFRSQEILDRHLRNVHKVGIDKVPKETIWYHCHKCNYKSNRKCVLENHKKIHLKVFVQKPKQCFQCGHKFSRHGDLKRHLVKCKPRLERQINEDDVVNFLADGMNLTNIENVLSTYRFAGGNHKVEKNLMKKVKKGFESMKKWFTSQNIVLNSNPDKKSKAKVGQPYTTSVSYCKNLNAFVKFIKNGRKLKNVHYLISADGGQGKFTIVLHMFDKDNPGGVDWQGHKASGTRKSLVLLECDNAVENYSNMVKLFALLDLPNFSEKFKFTGDFKLLRIMLGLSGGNPTYGCPFCLGQKIKSSGKYMRGLARTLGFCKEQSQKFKDKSKSVKSTKANEHYNCINTPVEIMNEEDDNWTLLLFPPGPLHTIVLGGPNDLMKAIKKKHLAKFTKFAKKFGHEMTEGKGGQFNGVSIRSILTNEEKLQFWKTELPQGVGDAVYDYMKATWDVYLVCTQTEVNPLHPTVFKNFRSKFLTVKSMLPISHTVKIHTVIGE